MIQFTLTLVPHWRKYYSTKGTLLGLSFSYVIDDTFPNGETGCKKTADADMAGSETGDFNPCATQHEAAALNALKTIIKKAAKKCSAKAKKKIPDSELKEKVGKSLKVLHKRYQKLVHSERSFIKDREWLKARRDEKCAYCLLDKICHSQAFYNSLKPILPSGLYGKQLKRLCKETAIHLAKPFHEKEDELDCSKTKDSRFRTIDGTCNNIKNTKWGSANTQFIRLLNPDYADYVSSPRVAQDGYPLPNARNVSRVAHGGNQNQMNPDSKSLTHAAMSWGQFLDHDITLSQAQGLNCEDPSNPECFNIEIPDDDKIFRRKGVEFIELERDAPKKSPVECSLRPREHVNTLSAFIDISQVYGVEEKLTDTLRGEGGTLRDVKHPNGCPFQRLLPPLPKEKFCVSKDPHRPCFMAGDERTNENQALMSFHTLFVREHNRIAEVFSRITEWNDERIFQETRKILGAYMQIITYGEWLPVILGQTTRDNFDLNLLKGKEYFNGYDPRVNPAISAVFAVAAFRFGHSLVQDDFRRFREAGFKYKDCNKHEGEFRPIPVKDFGNPTYLYEKCEGGIDALWRGLVKDAAAKADGKFSSAVQEHLFRGPGDNSDLCAINVQRGRDRGLPSYVKYRNSKFCGLPDKLKVRSFDDLVKKAKFNEEDRKNLEKLYNKVDDIDAFTGILLEGREPFLKGGLFGPTFQCLMGDQFKRLRKGDRFWFENKPKAKLHTDKTAFTRCQLRELRKVTLAKIICNNSDGILSMRENVFKLSSGIRGCERLQNVNLKLFTDDYNCDQEGDEPSAEY